MELEMLKTIIEKTLGRNMDAITEKTTFVDDLGVDSLDFFQILIDLEETFDVRIPAVPATRRVHVGVIAVTSLMIPASFHALNWK